MKSENRFQSVMQITKIRFGLWQSINGGLPISRPDLQNAHPWLPAGKQRRSSAY
jgi:hypothetical protein